jgi:hypothetical protein
MNQYNLNDVVYFRHGTIVGKCRIEEIINHQTQTELITKYVSHVYGIKEPITFTPEQLYTDLIEAKKDTQVALSKQFDGSMKGLSELTYDSFMEQINKKKEEVEKTYIENVESLNKIDDKFFDNKEKEYLKKVKKENK